MGHLKIKIINSPNLTRIRLLILKHSIRLIKNPLQNPNKQPNPKQKLPQQSYNRPKKYNLLTYKSTNIINFLTW